MEEHWVHRFEQAGLGKPPFKVVGFEESVFRPVPDAPLQAGSSCDFCGTGIRYVLWIESADGKRFKIGTDCAERVRDTELLEAARKEERRYQHERRSKLRKDQFEEERRREQAALDRQAAENVDRYGETIRVATELLKSEELPQRYREVVAQRLEGLVTGRWSRDLFLDEQWSDKKKMFDIAQVIGSLPTSKSHWKKGERIGPVKVLYELSSSFQTSFGLKKVRKYRVIEGPFAGAVLVWFTSSVPYPIRATGEILSLTGTVKEIKNFEGTTETSLTRVKID